MFKKTKKTSRVSKTLEIYSKKERKPLFVINLQTQYVFLIQSNAFALFTSRKSLQTLGIKL